MKISKTLLFLGLLLFQLHFAQEKADVVLNKALSEAKSKNKCIADVSCIMVQMVPRHGKEHEFT